MTKSLKIVLHQLNDPQIGMLTSRPSKICKSPYVGDVQINNNDKTPLVHTPSLGCCGLVEKNCSIVMTEIDISKKKPKLNQEGVVKPTCVFRAELAYVREGPHTQLVGVNPALAETIAENAIITNCIQGLTLRDPYSYSRQTTYLNSRFDFSGITKEGEDFILEIKNVPLADYVDVPKKERKQHMRFIESKAYNEKIAYFPDGYRKSGQDVVSPRALKHVQELEQIKRTTNKRAILCFVIGRDDVSSFQPSVIDPTYRKAVQKAWVHGVEIKTIQVKWSSEGKCYFVRNDLPITLFDQCGPIETM